MKQTKKPGGKPVSVELDKSLKVSDQNNNATKVFFVAVLDLSWQMAIVVLFPIIGGYELDKYFNTTPLLTIVGFLLAMAGTYVVIKRVLKSYNNTTASGAKEQK